MSSKQEFKLANTFFSVNTTKETLASGLRS